MSEHRTDVAAARDLIHPIIEGVGTGLRCRWQMDTLCPAYHQAQAVVEALHDAGWRPPVACRSCDGTGYLRGGQHDGEECPACTEEGKR